MEESEKCYDNSSGKNYWVQGRSTSQKFWITQEMADKMAERRKFKHQFDECSKKEYRRLNNELEKRN
jgi:hypothetical protein